MRIDSNCQSRSNTSFGSYCRHLWLLTFKSDNTRSSVWNNSSNSQQTFSMVQPRWNSKKYIWNLRILIVLNCLTRLLIRSISTRKGSHCLNLSRLSLFVFMWQSELFSDAPTCKSKQIKRIRRRNQPLSCSKANTYRDLAEWLGVREDCLSGRWGC